MRFVKSVITSPGPVNAKDNRWVSEDTQFIVRRYTYNKQHGVRSRTYIKPYYTAFHKSNKYRAFATYLYTWKEVVEACEAFTGWPNHPYKET